MSNIDKQALRWKAEKATQGEWWSDSCGNEGTYGSGDDCVEGFTSYAVYGENNQILLDTLNSTAACISEEYDGEGHVPGMKSGSAMLNLSPLPTRPPFWRCLMSWKPKTNSTQSLWRNSDWLISVRGKGWSIELRQKNALRRQRSGLLTSAESSSRLVNSSANTQDLVM